MAANDEDENCSLEEWLKDVRARHENQLMNLELLDTAERLDEAKIRSLDSTLKKTTAFMKKLKNIGTTVSPASLLPDLERLNVSKFLDEIAASVCEAKIKIAELPSLSDFCVRIASMYTMFPEVLLDEMKKHIPHKRSDKVENPSKLRVDLRFLAELVLNGVLRKDGVQLLGSVLSYLVATDKTEHVHVSILMPFCRSALFDLTGVAPLKYKEILARRGGLASLTSNVLEEKQKISVKNLLKDYFYTLLNHVNEVRVDMNRLRKTIKRQERTKGDASADDRQKFDQLKATYDRLLQNAKELGECLGEEMPQMVEEPSDDEQDELAAKKLDTDLTEGRVSLWPDRDMHKFYEVLVDILHLTPASKPIEEEGEAADSQSDKPFLAQSVEESIDAVDVSNLELAETPDTDGQEDEEADDTVDDEEYRLETEQHDASQAQSSEEVSAQSHVTMPMPSQNYNEFLGKLTSAINKQLIDAAAVEYVTVFDKKANRKRLVNHLLAAPSDRLDLLPFYARFIATVRPALPDIALHVSHELINRFREIESKPCQPVKKGDRKSANQVRIDVKVHLSKYISELVKFSILPKAEALSCMRKLLVDLRQYKVDMLCAMVESMGVFLYRSPETHPKMSVVLDVIQRKSSEKIKDPRQKLLLENAYFCVVPPTEESAPLTRLPPMEEFILMKIVNADDRTDRIMRRIDWSDKDTAGFALKCLENPTNVGFDSLENLASLVSALSEFHDWIGVYVVDSVLEFLRLSFEINHPSLQQRTFSAVAYLGQLFNYNVCGTAVIFKVLYQLVTFGVWDVRGADALIVRIHRIPLVCELVNSVCEFFCSGACKKRMDTFFDFFLRFYYETTETWPRFEQELGRLPREPRYVVDEMFDKWRRGEKFAKSLEEAKERVEVIERQYKAKVDEIMQGMKSAQASEAEGMRRLNCILEEMDDEEGDYEEEEEEEQHGLRVRKRNEESVCSIEEDEETTPEQASPADEADDEEQIRVHTQRKVLPEDEDFMREFNRVMMESMQTAPPSLKAPMTDLEVPPSARQKFERKITFADAQPETCRTEDTTEARQSLTAGMTSGTSTALEASRPQVALMTRGKGNHTVLKAVKLETSQSMQEAWREYQQVRERERKEVKKLTLAFDERQQMDQGEEAPAASTVPSSIVGQPGSDWH